MPLCLQCRRSGVSNLAVIKRMLIARSEVVGTVHLLQTDEKLGD